MINTLERLDFNFSIDNCKHTAWTVTKKTYSMW